jgi:outer membrane lipoprotein
MPYRSKGYLWCVFCLWVLTSMGCAHTVSESVRQQAVPPVPFTQLRAEPDAYVGRTVIFGGDILSTRNVEQKTFIEILQKPLDRSETPQVTDQSGGRFMALCDGYLDPAVYAEGRQITVAGRVIGTHTGKVGEIEYVYPLLACLETHLLPRATAVAGYYYPYPDPWYWYPWYWYRKPFFYHRYPFYYW